MHVYTQLGGNSSYVEVCPILDPAPTSSGDYTQPVRVERNLPLQTRNLPEPVSEWEQTIIQIQCSMNSMVKSYHKDVRTFPINPEWCYCDSSYGYL